MSTKKVATRTIELGTIDLEKVRQQKDGTHTCDDCGTVLKAAAGIKNLKRGGTVHPYTCPKCQAPKRVQVHKIREPKAYIIKDYGDNMFKTFYNVMEVLERLFEEEQNDLRQKHQPLLPFSLQNCLYSLMHYPNFCCDTEITHLIDRALAEALSDEQMYRAMRVLFFAVIGQQDQAWAKKLSEECWQEEKKLKGMSFKTQDIVEIISTTKNESSLD